MVTLRIGVLALMAIAFTGNIKAEQSTSSVTSFTSTAMTVTAGNGIVACMCSSINNTLVASDSTVSTYNQAVIKQNTISVQTVAISVATGITGGSTTYKVTPGASAFCSISAQEYSGLASGNPSDATTNTGEAASTAVNPGAVNPPGTGDLYVAAWVHNGSVSQAFTFNVSGEGWNQRANLTNTANQPLGSQDFIGSGSKTGSATLGTSATWDAAVATFKAAAGATRVPYQPWYQMAPVLAQ